MKFVKEIKKNSRETRTKIKRNFKGENKKNREK